MNQYLVFTERTEEISLRTEIVLNLKSHHLLALLNAMLEACQKLENDVLWKSFLEVFLQILGILYVDDALRYLAGQSSGDPRNHHGIAPPPHCVARHS